MLEIMDADDLKRLLGPFPVRCPLDAVLLETADCGLYVRETIEYAVEANERVKSFLLVPKHINRGVPAIFARRQHASQFHLGKSEVVGLKGDADQAYASELAERGYVVIAPDALAFEERNWSAPSGYAEYYELATRLVQGRTLLSNASMMSAWPWITWWRDPRSIRYGLDSSAIPTAAKWPSGFQHSITAFEHQSPIADA
jgi:hypothetical protein